MPRLLLLRHATAERTQPGSTDHERALTGRGRKDSAAIGTVIAERGDSPDLVLCSTSARTRETWEVAHAALGGAAEVRFLTSLYEAPDYLAVLRREGGTAGTLLVIGHNPAMHETAKLVATDLSGREGGTLRDGFPKAALAVFDFDGEWRSVAPRRMRLVAFIPPERA